MAYSVKQNFLDQLTEEDLLRLTGNDDTKITKAVEKADSLIDGYLASAAVEVPLTTVPAVIMQCSVDIALFHLHSRIQFESIPDFIKDRYDAAINYLKDVATGKAILNIDEEEQEDKINYGGNDLQMSRDMF